MSGDGSKIWYKKEDKEIDRLQLFLWEKGKDGKQLLDMDLANGYVASLSGETGEVYYMDRNPEDMASESGSLFDDMKVKQEKRENGQSGPRDALYYYKDGETVMLSEDVYDCAYGEEEGIFWYEEERADEEGAVVRYLVKDGQSWELKGVPCDGCEYPQMYSPEEECCYLVCYDAEEDEETEESGDMSGMFPDLFGQTEAQDDEKAATIEFPVEDEAYTGGLSAEETAEQQD